jgi:pyruvate dehydrogenase E1 component alpha subunit
VDGNDVLAVYEAVLAADEHARSGQGPSLIDCFSYRWRGHSKSDRNLYRTHEEIDGWKRNVRLSASRKFCGCGSNDQQRLRISIAAKAAVDRAAEEAQTYPEPSPKNMEDEVYAL